MQLSAVALCAPLAHTGVRMSAATRRRVEVSRSAEVFRACPASAGFGGGRAMDVCRRLKSLSTCLGGFSRRMRVRPGRRRTRKTGVGRHQAAADPRRKRENSFRPAADPRKTLKSATTSHRPATDPRYSMDKPRRAALCSTQLPKLEKC